MIEPEQAEAEHEHTRRGPHLAIAREIAKTRSGQGQEVGSLWLAVNVTF